jgi:hypothetical protein
MSANGGKSFTEAEPMFAQKIPVPSHVQLALDGQRVVATWDEMSARGASVALRVSRDGGATFDPAVTLSDTQRSAQYPVVGLNGQTAYVAWSQTNGTAVPTTAEMPAMAAHEGMKMGGGAMKMGLHPVGETQVLMREVRWR